MSKPAAKSKKAVKAPVVETPVVAETTPEQVPPVEETAETPVVETPAEELPAAEEPAVDENPTAEKLLEGLPTDPKDYTEEQLQILMARYKPVMQKLSPEDVLKIRAIGKPATDRLLREAKAKAAAATKAPKMKQEKLAPLIAEMNEVMSIHPPIDPLAADAATRVMTELKDVKPEDFVANPETPDKVIFTKDAVKLIRKLGMALPGEKKPKGGNGKVVPKRVKVEWVPLVEDKMPPVAPKGQKLNARILGYRAFLKSKGKITAEEMVAAVKAGGEDLKITSAVAYVYDFTRNSLLPKFR